MKFKFVKIVQYSIRLLYINFIQLYYKGFVLDIYRFRKMIYSQLEWLVLSSDKKMIDKVY